MRKYPAAFKERAVKLAVESEQPIAQTARDLGVGPAQGTQDTCGKKFPPTVQYDLTGLFHSP